MRLTLVVLLATITVRAQQEEDRSASPEAKDIARLYELADQVKDALRKGNVPAANLLPINSASASSSVKWPSSWRISKRGNPLADVAKAAYDASDYHQGGDLREGRANPSRGVA
jgi:hypothetical protein